MPWGQGGGGWGGGGTLKDRSDGGRASEIFTLRPAYLLVAHAARVDIYILKVQGQVYYLLHLQAGMHKNPRPPSLAGPSLDGRKTALSRAAVQLFSVAKHVSV